MWLQANDAARRRKAIEAGRAEAAEYHLARERLSSTAKGGAMEWERVQDRHPRPHPLLPSLSPPPSPSPTFPLALALTLTSALITHSHLRPHLSLSLSPV